jgi:hypothetical protein
MKKYILEQRDESTGLWEHNKTYKDYTTKEVDFSYFFGLYKGKKKVKEEVDIAELRKVMREDALALRSGSGKDVRIKEYFRVCNNDESGSYYSWEFDGIIWKNGVWLD